MTSFACIGFLYFTSEFPFNVVPLCISNFPKATKNVTKVSLPFTLNIKLAKEVEL